MKHFYLCAFLIAFFKINAQIELVSSDVTFFQKPLKTANGIYFSGSNTDVGVEPYFYDGSSNPVNLKDIYVGTQSSFAGGFIEFQGKIFFAARDSADNFELWNTDGTESGTNLFKEINASSTQGSYPSDFVISGSNLLFTARESIGNPELFISDGTVSGTVLLKEILTGSQYGSSPEYKTEFNGMVYFSASNGGGNNGFEIWRTDGTVVGTNLFLDIATGTPSSYPNSLFVHNGLLFFNADDGINGRELRYTNGNTGINVLVNDLNPGPVNALDINSEFCSINNKLYFSADNGSTGKELWYYDTNTNNISLTNSVNPSGGSEPYNFVELNGNLFFSANDGVNGRELHKIDGVTNVFTHFNLNPTSSSDPSKGIVMNNRLYFAADDGTHGRELWVTDGTITGTQMVADLNPGSGSSFPDHLINFNGELIFSTTAGIYKFNDSVLGVNTLESNYAISLYPNPSNSSIKLKGVETIDSLEIFDLTGKSVKQYNTLQDSYDISELKAGIYFVSIKANNATQSIKLIKN
ncbi:MAG: T9SS type A sorting domain-containing protein [Flavobacteriaceae bacterium]